MEQISPAELQAWLADGGKEKPLLLDVREPWEFDYCQIEGSMLLPMGEIPQRFNELDKKGEVVVICHHGVRSYHVARFLEHNGFERVYNLRSGVDGWARDVDPSMRKY